VPETRLKYQEVISASYLTRVKVLALSFASWPRGKVKKRKGSGEADFGHCPFTSRQAVPGTMTADYITGIKPEKTSGC